jgi:purine-binding chemotaxis protein CheW
MSDEEGSASEQPLLVFRVAEHRCAISLSNVQEVLPMVAMVVPPGRPPIIEGFLNVRGQTVPAVSLRRLFRLPPEEASLYTPLILVDVHGQKVAFIADAVEDVAHVPQSRFQHVPAGDILNDCAEACFESDAGVVTVLAAQRLLLAEEQAALSELASGVRQRIAELECPGV